MPYRATLDGAEIGSGTMQDIQAASAQAITGLLAQDPDGVAMSAQDANRAFQSGAVEKAIETDGQWTAPFWVHGRPEKLIVTRGDES
jgi:hypothetical protein